MADRFMVYCTIINGIIKVKIFFSISAFLSQKFSIHILMKKKLHVFLGLMLK
jgi:hypothetical protein